MKKSNDSKKAFCVVRFAQPPFKGIKDYVCVPSSWIVIRRSLIDGKVLATYPSSENPLENKARAKRREKPRNTWFVYKATIKYECNSFKDAEHWIATRNDNEESTEDPENKESEPEPEPVLDRKLRSATRYSASNSSQDKSQLAMERSKNPRKPKMNEKNTSQQTKDELLVQPGSSINASTSSNEKQSSTVNENCRKEASMPLLDDCGPNEVTIIDQEVQPDSQIPPPASEPECLKELLQKQNVQKPSARGPKVFNKNNCQKTNPHCAKMAAPNIAPKLAPKPSTSGSHLYQKNQPNLTVCGKSSKPRETRRERSTNMTHDEQRPHQHIITKNTLFTPYHLPTSVKTSSQLYHHPSKNQLSSVINNPNTLIGSQNIIHSTNQPCSIPPCSIERLTHLVTQSHQQETPLPPEMYGGHLITGNSNQGSLGNTIAAEKMHYKRSDIVNPIGIRTCHQDITDNTSVAQNLSNPAHHARCSIQQPEYLLTKDNNLQQIPQVQYKDTHVITPENQNFLQSMTLYNAMSQLLAKQNQTQLVDPHSFFYPKLNPNLQVPVDQNYLQQELLSEVRPRIFTESDQIDHTPHPQSRMYVSCTEQNSSNVSNQLVQDSELLQPPNHQESRNSLSHTMRPGIPIKSKIDRQKPGLQGVTKRPPLPPIASNIMRQPFLTAQGNYPIQDLSTQGRPNKRYIEQNVMAWAAPQNIMAEPTPVMQNFDVHCTSSSDRSHEVQTQAIYENQVYQNPCSFNMEIDQSTNTSLNAKHVTFLDGTVGSSAAESPFMKIDKMCQTDECLSEESQSPDPELVTDHDAVADHEATSDHDMSAEETPVEIISNDRTAETILPQRDFTEPIPKPYTLADKKQAQSRIEVKQQLRHEISNLFVVMNTKITNTYDNFNSVQSQIDETAKLYQKMVEAFNVMKNCINTTISSNVVPKTSQVPDENQSGQININNRNNNNIDLTKAPKYLTKNFSGYRHTFVYPPDYDPKDSKWTLKYRKSAPGVVELMPQSDIYVGYLRFEYCKRVSKDCRTLVRMLLPEVFSLSALSVCSLAGKKEKASDGFLDIRPGLDKWARMVLLKFVEKVGLQCGWKTFDQQGILSGMQEKIFEIRAKYGETTRVPILYLPNRLVTA